MFNISKDIINKYKEYIFHIQEYNDNISIYIIKNDGKALVRATYYFDMGPVDEGVPQPNIFISDLYVYPEIRNNHIGQELLTICGDIANELNIKFIELYAENNSWVIKWYENNGFENLGPIDDILVAMYKEI